MFDREKMNDAYHIYAQGIENRSETELATILREKIAPTLLAAIDVAVPGSKEANSVTDLLQSQTLIDRFSQEKNGPEKLKNQIMILLTTAKDLVNYCQSHATNADDEESFKKFEELAHELEFGKYDLVRKQLLVAKLLLPYSLQNKDALANLQSNDENRYHGIFFLRPYNIPDDIIPQLQSIVNNQPTSA